jgi:hypothetical protein
MRHFFIFLYRTLKLLYFNITWCALILRRHIRTNFCSLFKIDFPWVAGAYALKFKSEFPQKYLLYFSLSPFVHLAISRLAGFILIEKYRYI